MPTSMVEVERKDKQMCAGTAAHKLSGKFLNILVFQVLSE